MADLKIELFPNAELMQVIGNNSTLRWPSLAPNVFEAHKTREIIPT